MQGPSSTGTVPLCGQKGLLGRRPVIVRGVRLGGQRTRRQAKHFPDTVGLLLHVLCRFKCGERGIRVPKTLQRGHKSMTHLLVLIGPELYIGFHVRDHFAYLMFVSLIFTVVCVIKQYG